MKFLYRLGKFLFIINNEFEGTNTLKQILVIYASKLGKKAPGKNLTELNSFGENSGCAIAVISATSTNYGTVLHSNEEIEHILGYQRKDVIGKNISFIMPSLIA